MLVYRNNRRTHATADLLSALLTEVAHLGLPPRHDAIRDLLVTFDAFESGVADACNPEKDGVDAVQSALGRTALALAALFLTSMRKKGRDLAAERRRLTAELTALRALPLPATISTAEAEGYAWYALFPEAYVLATRQFLAEVRPRAAVCIGIRQIGCSLSALATAVLVEAGCPVSRFTVRPRGHPCAREFRPAPALIAALRRQAECADFLLIDEGPGQSGSSLCCIAEVLANWGIAEERISFFPSWMAEASQLSSATARHRWPRHRKIVGAFAPLPEIAPSRKMTVADLGAGRWRERLLSPSAWPPVQPQHERSKFLFYPDGIPVSAQAKNCLLAKFSGFAATGNEAQARGSRLAAAGFTPPVLGRQAGFLLYRFLPGRSLVCRDITAGLLERIATYLAFLRCDFPAMAATSAEDLCTMLRHNVAEGLGERWAMRLPELTNLYIAAPAIAIDGRMLPHEWLQTPEGLLKTDAIDHHADHFFPGGTDIAWDLAATEIEFRLSKAQTAFLLRRYGFRSGDTQVARRLPFYRFAWLAFRLGYAHMAAESLGHGGDAAQFWGNFEWYRRRLKKEIAEVKTHP